MRLFPKVEEDRPTPKEVYNLRTYLFAAIASAGAATIGYDSAFIGGTLALQSFKDEFNFETMSEDEVNLLTANIVSCYQAGAFFGAIFAYLGGHYLGRRLGLIIFGVLFVIGAGIMLASNGARGFALMYAGRVIAGLGVGAISNLIPIYISELSPPAIRGRLVGMWEVGWQSGGLVGFWINVSPTVCAVSFYEAVDTNIYLHSMPFPEPSPPHTSSGLFRSRFNLSRPASLSSEPFSPMRVLDG